jgi:starch synthase
VLEALAAGVPVVASRIGGLPESIEDGISGLLVTPDNSGELADAILRLVQDEELQRSMSQAARERAEDAFSWNRVRDDLLSIYEDICSR